MAIKLYRETDYESITSGGTDGFVISEKPVKDAFTDANGTGLDSHAPDLDSVGNGWASMALRSTFTPGGGTIQGNQLQLGTDNAGHAIDSGLSDAIVEADWTPAVGADNRNSIIFRYTTDGNHWALRVREPNGDIVIEEVTADAGYDRASAAFTWTEGQTYRLKVVINGDSIKGYVDGVQKVSYTSSVRETATKHGLARHTGADASRFDNFRVRGLDGPLDGGIFDTEADAEGTVLKLAARTDNGSGTATVQPMGDNASQWALSSDGETWESWGASLSLGTVGATNVVFYAKAKGLTTDDLGKDTSVDLKVTYGSAAPGFETERRVVPHLQDLGTSGSHYLGFDFEGDIYEHGPVNGGEFNIIETDGTSGNTHNNVKHSTHSKVGDIITMTKSLTNCDVTTTVTKKKAGVYLYEVTIENKDTSERRFRVIKNLTGANTDNTSTVTLFKDSGIRDISYIHSSGSSDLIEAFQALALHHASGAAAGLVLDNGYVNDWCLYHTSYLGQTSWYNNELLVKTASQITLSYGKLANGSTSDYSIHIAAGQSKTLKFVVVLDAPDDQAEVNRMLYSGLHDAAYSGSGTRTEVEKMLWSTAWQLQRIKRHYHGESKWHWQVPAKAYAPDLYPIDSVWQGMGLNDPTVAEYIIYTLHNLGSQDSTTYSAGNAMDASEPAIKPEYVLYCKNFFGYTPSSAVITQLTEYADGVAASLGKMLPVSYTGQFGRGTEGYGDFEDALSFDQSGTTRYRWATATQGAGSAAFRVGTDGGNAPHGGSYQLKLVADTGSGDYARAKSMRIAVPASTAFTATAWVNIPTGFSANGFRIHIYETDSSDSAVTDHYGLFYTSTTGYDQKSYGFTTNASTAFIRIAVEAVGDEAASRTAYVDDVNCTMDTPPYDGMMWSNYRLTPDSRNLNTLECVGMVHVYSILGMRCAKELIGANWTQTHQDALDDLEATYPAAFWRDANHEQLRFSLYHPLRKDWLHIAHLWHHFEWYILSGGEKFFTDQEIADIYANYPATAIGWDYGDVAFKGMVVKYDGSYCESSEFLSGFGDGGHYQNGGSWLLYDAMLHLSAHYAGVSGARDNLNKRLQVEVAKDYSSHEWLETDPGLTYYQTCLPDQRAYGWNVILLAEAIPFALAASNVDAEGCDLTWDEYTGGSFDYYSVCRSESPNVTKADQIDTVTPSTTHTYHDTTADPDTTYYYKVFVVKTAGADLQSEEIQVTTASLVVRPAVQSMALSVASAVVSAGASLALAAQSVMASVPAPTVVVPHTELPEARSVAVSVPAPTVTTGPKMKPAAQSVTVSISTPAAKAGARLSSGAQALTVSAQAPVVKHLRDILPLGLAVSLMTPEVVVPVAAVEARGRTRLEPVRLVEVELKNSGPTLYFSDRNIEVGGQRYENYIEDLSGLGEGLRRAESPGPDSLLTLRFKNDAFESHDYLVEVGDTYPFEGAVVTVKEVYLDPPTGSGQAARQSETVELFKGILDEPRDIDLLGFTCGATSMEYAKDREWKQPVINTSDYEFAHEDLGEIEPIIYGSDVLAPALRVDWGARTTLQAQASPTGTSLVLSDASRFPSSGSVWVDDEKVSYTDKSGNTLTGCSRAQDGTAATSHRAGADVVEARAQYDSLLAAHGLHSVGDVYAEIDRRLYRVTSGVSAVLSGEKHLLRATDHVRVEAIEDGTGVDNYYTPPVRKVIRHATDLPLQWEGFASGVYATYLNFPSAPQGMTLTNVRLRLYTYVSSLTAPNDDVLFYLGDSSGTKICKVDAGNNLHYYLELPVEVSKSGWVTSQKITKSGGYAPDTFFTIYDAVIEADVVSGFSGDVDGGRVERSGTNQPKQSSSSVTVDFPSAPSGTLKDVYSEYEWSVAVNANPSSTVKFKVGSKEICWVTTSGIVVPFCEYRFQKSQTRWKTSQSLDVVNSHPDVVFTVKKARQFALSSSEESVSSAAKSGGVYGTHVVERFHTVANGYESPDSAYGEAGSLIERPDHVMKHFLVEVLGFSPGEIDTASFDAAGTSYASAISGGYRFAFRLDRRVRPSELLGRMARECRSALRYSAGKWRLDYIPDAAPGAVKTVAGGELAGEGAKFAFSRTPVEELSNELMARYRRNYSRLGSESEWDGTSSASDSTSQSKYGVYPRAVDFELVRDASMASHVLGHMLIEKKEPRLRVEFPVFWEHFDLEPGDTIEIESPFYGGRKFLIENVRRLDKFRARVRAGEWW